MRHGIRLPAGSIAPLPAATPFGGFRHAPAFGPEVYQPPAYETPALAQQYRPEPWEYTNILPVGSSFTLGVERTLIGKGFESPGPGPVPFNMRSILDSFIPIAIDAFGREVRIFPSGTVVVWRLYVDGRPLRNFEAYGLAPGWREMADRSLTEFYAGQLFIVTAQIFTNGIGLTQVGARVRGRYEPVQTAHVKAGALATPGGLIQAPASAPKG